MGVPKFYRWLSERYPCLSEVINDTQIPEFDNLYLDMNGIIHNCSHPNDDDVTFRITEEQIFKDIFTYIEKLFRIIRPKKVFYMAIDGVAPRAKMNQQRARRFMSARTAEEQLEAARKKGEEIPDEKRFDSNCITPGTYFMTKLHSELQSFVERKINTDPSWQGIRVFLSGHDCPGEGEHKIMDFIRAERICDGYDPNTRHCMYGLDADLIMLGICSHEPHFSLLREEVKFTRPPKQGGKKNKKEPPKKSVPSETTFHLLHLSLLREYLAWEFHSIKEGLPFEYDMERIVDDWVLMGFLIGNDFIPHLPHVHIHDDALPLLYETYKQVLPRLDGYLNESGHLNLKRFEVFLKAVAENDRSSFMQIMDDEQFMLAKRGGRAAPGQAEEAINTVAEPTAFDELERYVDSDLSSDAEPDERDVEAAAAAERLVVGVDAAFVSSDEDEANSSDEKDSDAFELGGAAELLADMDMDPIEDEFSEALALAEFKARDDKEFENNVAAIWSTQVNNSFKRHKRDYYREKMNFGNISRGELRKQSEGYVRAIQWVLHYYYHGCVSWNWYFPHHYAPYISDVVDFSGMSMDFELSKPFRPFEQLLAVLPAASAECLPIPLRELMCSAESPIADFYPKDFSTDLNGKKNDWEAVVLIPFIDETRLLEAIESKSTRLSAEEHSRNSHGDHVLFTTDADKPSGQMAVRSLVPMNEFRIAQDRVVWGLLPNVKLDVYFPGFPTMKHRPHTAYLKEVNVKVFNMPSRRPSMVLHVKDTEEMKRDLLEIAFDLIGKEVCIDWPVLKVGLVDSIWSLEKKYDRLKYEEVTMSNMSDVEKDTAKKLISNLKDRQLSRYAIDTPTAEAVVFVRRFLGVTYEVEEGMLKPVKQWGGADTAVPVLLPLVVTNVLIEEGRRLNEMSVQHAYPPKSKVFVMEPKWSGFGFPAMVESIQSPGDKDCRVVVLAAVSKSPDMSSLAANYNQMSMPWMSGFEAGRRSGVNGRLLARLTGTMFMFNGAEKEETQMGRGMQEKINIGLSLKLSKKNQEVPNYTRRMTDGYWQYSILCVRLITEYRNKFPELISFLEQTDTADDVYYASDIWSSDKKRAARWSELVDYLGSIPTASMEKQEGGTEYVDSVMMSHIERVVKEAGASGGANFLKSSVNPTKLYRAELYDGKVRPDPEADFQLLDRVVNTVSGTVAPFGMQGTVIGVHADKIEVLFDKQFNGGYKRGELSSCALVPIPSLINISFALERKHTVETSTSHPQQQRSAAGKSSATRMSAGKDKDRMSSNYSQYQNQQPSYTKRNQQPGQPRDNNRNQQQQQGYNNSKSHSYAEGPSEPWVRPAGGAGGKSPRVAKRGEFGAPPQHLQQSRKPVVIARRPEAGGGVVDRKVVEDQLSAMLGLITAGGSGNSKAVDQGAVAVSSSKSPAKQHAAVKSGTQHQGDKPVSAEEKRKVKKEKRRARREAENAQRESQPGIRQVTIEQLLANMNIGGGGKEEAAATDDVTPTTSRTSNSNQQTKKTKKGNEKAATGRQAKEEEPRSDSPLAQLKMLFKSSTEANKTESSAEATATTTVTSTGTAVTQQMMLEKSQTLTPNVNPQQNQSRGGGRGDKNGRAGRAHDSWMGNRGQPAASSSANVLAGAERYAGGASPVPQPQRQSPPLGSPSSAASYLFRGRSATTGGVPPMMPPPPTPQQLAMMVQSGMLPPPPPDFLAFMQFQRQQQQRGNDSSAVFSHSRNNPFATDPKLTDLKPSTVSKKPLASMQKRGGGGRGGGAYGKSKNAGGPARSSQEGEVENQPSRGGSTIPVTAASAPPAISSSSTVPSANTASSRKKQRTSRLAVNFSQQAEDKQGGQPN